MLWYKSTQDPWEYKKMTTKHTFPHKNNHYTYIIFEINEFYSSVSTTYSNLTSSTVVFIIGDRNAKAGKYGERCIGSHGQGCRNIAGELLIHFCETFNLLLCNTS